MLHKLTPLIAATLIMGSAPFLHAQTQAPAGSPLRPACPDCGKVVSVQQIEKQGKGSGVGLVAGGVVGGVIGHQIGGGVGKTLATVGGAAGGAYAGNTIEKNSKSSKVWSVAVKYPNGSTSSYEFANAPGFKVGDRVRKSGNTVVRP